jgi:hypothetical protein
MDTKVLFSSFFEIVYRNIVGCIQHTKIEWKWHDCEVGHHKDMINLHQPKNKENKDIGVECLNQHGHYNHYE